MAFLERTRMDEKYRRAFTATILTYITTAKDIGKDPLGLAKLPLAASIVTGRELSLRLGKTVHKEKDSLFWVQVDPRTGKITGYKFLAPDLSKFRTKLNKQLKEWGKKSDIKKLMGKRALAIGIVAGVTAAVIVTTVVIVATAGAAAPAVAAAGSSIAGGGGGAAGAGGAAAAGAAGAAGAGGAAGVGTGGAVAATTAGGVTAGGVTAAGGGAGAAGVLGKTGLDLAMKGLSNAAARGGSIEDMANAAKSALPPGQAKALEAQGQQTAKDVEKEESGFSTLAVGLGVGTAVLAGLGLAVYMIRRET